MLIHPQSSERVNPLRWCDLTSLRAPEHLAAEDWLLEEAEAGRWGETLLVWEAHERFVVAGYANRVEREVNTAFCEEARIPIYRRTSGGGTVLQGPGCLNYGLILWIDHTGPTRSITTTNAFVMGRMAAALSRVVGQTVVVRGHTDLVIGDRKFSGNAQRRKRHFLIFHGCFLLRMDLQWVASTLRMPSIQPDYRANRGHLDFITNLGRDSEEIKTALAEEWQAIAPTPELPFGEIRHLVETRYLTKEWNRKF
jgi:lipoate-protein ligase A